MNFSGIAASTVLGKALRWPLRLVPAGLTVPILQGRLRGQRWITGAGNHGCWLGSYEYEKQHLFARVLTEGSVVYDVGANVGFYTMLAADLVGPSGKVMAFEPLPRNLQFLRRHVAINAYNNVQIIDAAVSDTTGEAKFDDGANSSMGQLTASGKLNVTTVCLDDLVSSATISPANFIKIDVEGAEHAVLSGAERLLSQMRPTVFLATHGDDVRDRCLALLREHGYSVRSLNGANLNDSDEFMASVKDWQ